MPCVFFLANLFWSFRSLSTHVLSFRAVFPNTWSIHVLLWTGVSVGTPSILYVFCLPSYVPGVSRVHFSLEASRFPAFL